MPFASVVLKVKVVPAPSKETVDPALDAPVIVTVEPITDPVSPSITVIPDPDPLDIVCFKS